MGQNKEVIGIVVIASHLSATACIIRIINNCTYVYAIPAGLAVSTDFHCS